MPVAEDGYLSELARELSADALERFLRYVQIDTASEPKSTSYPSTEKQLDLLRLLADECREAGLADVSLDENGYVTASVPATVERAVPTLGLAAHVDTYPGVTGTGVKPQVVRYEGGDLPLPGDPSQVLTPRDMPALDEHVGHELVTSDGTTLLGADDKAGVAEIMAAAAYLVRHPELEHGPIRLLFNPDEEIGRGTDRLDLAQFGADVAYTLDGSTRGEIEDETFSALKATITFVGRSAHSGTAKGVLVNAVKAAGDFLAALPREGLSPESTAGREGFVHPDEVVGNVEQTTVVVILRDFDDARLDEHAALVRRLAGDAAAGRGAEVEVTVEREYSNMKHFIQDPWIVEAAEEAIRRAGMEPTRAIIRGGHGRLTALGEGPPLPQSVPRVDTTTTPAANGSACRTWAPPRRRSSTSPRSGAAQPPRPEPPSEADLHGSMTTSYARSMRSRLTVLGAVIATAAVSAALWSTAGGASVMRSTGTCHITQKKSLSGATKTNIKFVNTTAGTVQLYWLDYKGHLVYYATVAHGASILQPTFKTHPWLALDSNFACVGYVIAPKVSYVIS